MENNIVFDIGEFLEKSTGKSEVFAFNAPYRLEDGDEIEEIEGRVEIMKVDEGFNVHVLSTSIPVEFTCNRCLKRFKQKIEVENIERLFLMNKPEKVDDPNNVFLVDTKHMTIDISELLRQEIILQFPENPVCYTSCKGICSHCGENLNKKSCTCKSQDSENYRPLSILKELIK